jgi:glycosyltransferase involved in cell wall biosynthesis
LRLLIVTPYHAPAYAFGGPVKVTETMAAGFLAAGHHVTVATTDVLDERRRVPAGAPAVPAGTEVRRFPNVSNTVAARAMGWTPRGFRRWVAREAGAYDLVHLHDVYSVLSVAASRSAARAGVPSVLQPFGSLAPTPERGKPLIKRAFLRLWGRRTLALAAANVYSTQDERADFLAAGAPEGSLVRLPLPLELPPALGEPRAQTPTLAYVGRLDPIKGLDVLLRAVAIAREQIPGLRLELAGPGEAYRATLERLASELGIADAVSFLGFISPEEKVRLLERAHAFCLLSRSEGLPVAALEAMACGTPVLVSPGCHLPEVDRLAGRVVERDPAAVAAAIEEVLADDGVREAMGARARAFADQFRHEVAMPHIVAAFEAIADRRPPAGTRP